MNIKSSPILKNIAWLIGDKFVRLFFGAVIGGLIARTLGPSEYGYFSYAISILAICSIVSACGLDQTAIFRYSQENITEPTLTGTILYSRIFISTCTLCALALAIKHITSPSHTFPTLLICLSLIPQSFDTLDIVFQSKSKSKISVLSKGAAYILTGFLKLIFIFLDPSFTAFAFCTLFEAILGAIFLLITYSKSHTISYICFNFQLSKSLLLESLPYLFSSLCIVLYMRIDQVLLKHLSTPYELGLYSAAQPLSLVWSFIPTSIAISFTPLATKARLLSAEEYDSIKGSLYTIMWVILLPLTAIIFATSPIIIHTLFGSAFSPSIPILQLLTLSILPIGLGVAQRVWIIQDGQSKYYFLRSASGLVIDILLNILLIPHFGAIGAAISSVTAQIFSTVLINSFFDPKTLLAQLYAPFKVRKSIAILAEHQSSLLK